MLLFTFVQIELDTLAQFTVEFINTLYYSVIYATISEIGVKGRQKFEEHEKGFDRKRLASPGLYCVVVYNKRSIL